MTSDWLIKSLSLKGWAGTDALAASLLSSATKKSWSLPASVSLMSIQKPHTLLGTRRVMEWPGWISWAGDHMFVHAFNLLMEPISIELHLFPGSLAVSWFPALAENKHCRENLKRLIGRQWRKKKKYRLCIIIWCHLTDESVGSGRSQGTQRSWDMTSTSGISWPTSASVTPSCLLIRRPCTADSGPWKAPAGRGTLCIRACRKNSGSHGKPSSGFRL